MGRMGPATMPRRARPDTAAPEASARTNRVASTTSRHTFSTMRDFRQDTQNSRGGQAMRLRHTIIHHQEREHQRLAQQLLNSSQEFLEFARSRLVWAAASHRRSAVRAANFPK